MSLKLPILLVSVAVSAVALSVGPEDSRSVLPWSGQASPAPEPALLSAQLAAEDGGAEPGLNGVARDILALQPKMERPRAAAPTITPFQLSQIDQSRAEGETTGTDDAEDAFQRAGPAVDADVEVDETALRYFAAQGDTARLAAEIARLRQLYPNWTPPTDPLAVPLNSDRQLENMWELYAAGRLSEVRRAIVERQTADPAWQPPADLLDRLEMAEARARLTNASELKQYQTVIDVAASNPALLNCSEVDALWRVAEAFVGSERPQRAIDAYRYILTNCTNPMERAATVQKAAALLDYAAVQPLLALETRTPSGAGEFDSIRDDLARRFVAQAGEDPSLEIAPEFVDRLTALAGGNGVASDAQLLGWYHLRRNNADEAAIWFGRARDREDSADASQGLALSLLEQAKPAEAEAVLYRWRDSSEDVMASYLAATANLIALDPPPVLEAEVLTRMAQTVIGERYAPSAQQLGWYARAFDQPQTAAQWFQTALEWAPQDEASAYGLALTRLQLNDRAGFLELQRQWAGQSSRIADLSETPNPDRSQLPSQPVEQREPVRQATPEARPVQPAQRSRPSASAAVRATAGGGSGASTGCSRRVEVSRLSPAAALARGWCLMELNRPMEAAQSFAVAVGAGDGRLSEDAAYGQSLAYLRLGLTDRAAVAATQAPMTSVRARELQASILADRAIQAFQADRYRETLLYLDQRMQVQQEPVDLMVLRGYSYINLNRPYDALRIFEAAAATGSRDASRGLADAKAAVGLN